MGPPGQLRLPAPSTRGEPCHEAPTVFLTRAQCLEFAVGKIGTVLGPDYAEVDSFPTRVRLPEYLVVVVAMAVWEYALYVRDLSPE